MEQTLFRNPMVVQLVDKLYAFCGRQKFIIVFTNNIILYCLVSRRLLQNVNDALPYNFKHFKKFWTTCEDRPCGLVVRVPGCKTQRGTTEWLHKLWPLERYSAPQS
jgi:hypothetical protein